MRARVRRTAACAPHGTTRPHDLPQKSGERRYTGVEPATPTIHSRGPANPSERGSPRDVAVRLQDNPPLAATSQADHRRRPRRPARARSPRKHPDATGSSIVDGQPPCCTPRPAHAWCGPSDALRLLRRSRRPDALPPVDGPGAGYPIREDRDPVMIAACGNRDDVRACRQHRMPYRCDTRNPLPDHPTV